MAMPSITNNSLPTLQIEAVQTVPPVNVTNPRETRHLSVAAPVGPWIFRGSLNILLCYNKAAEEDSGWLVAGWIKESLGKALHDQPLLTGRLRRGEDGRGELEIVSNDSGGRLIEAKIGITLQEFLELKDKEKLEGELVFWEEIDEQNPQFSPLLYIQVTNFNCGGYSVGISCSLLLADLLIMENFLQKWAIIHKEMVTSRNGEMKKPIFYLPGLKANSLFCGGTLTSTPSKNSGQAMIFKIVGKDFKKNEELSKTLALVCIEEAESKLGSGFASSDFSLLAKESASVIKVQNFKKHELLKSNLDLGRNQVTSSSWDDLGLNQVAFREGNEPGYASYWFGSINGALIIEIPSANENGTSEVKIIITIPPEKDTF